MCSFAALAFTLLMNPPAMNPTLAFPTPDRLVVRLNGKTIIEGEEEKPNKRPLSEVVFLVGFHGPATPMYLGYPHGPRTADWTPDGAEKRSWHLQVKDPTVQIRLWTPLAGERSACTTDPRAPLAGSFGPAVAPFDDAIYDRADDWLLEVNMPVKRGRRGYEFNSNGQPFELKTNYFRDHLGYFLWDRSRPLWKDPIAGWCSWAAYGQGITEKEVEEAARFFSKNLKDYGYKVIQIDDGYQRVLQITDNHQPITEPFSNYWTKPNEKFPAGMAALAQRISALGMTPGIWIGLYLPLGLEHKEGYVTGGDGKPLQGPWVGYSMRPDDAAAVKEAYTDTLTTFREQGWKYFKIDTLRHILYDSYRRVPELWASRGTDSSHAYRALFEAVRKAVGPENYLLACWGALPELAGLPDGCRIGEDVGPSFDSMRKSAKYIAQFHYANNVIWRDDPDYMCFRVPLEQCRAWATLTSLTGGQVMVSDPIETYDPARVDILRRVGPVPMTSPMNVAPMGPDPEWVTLHCAKGGEQWTVAARFGWGKRLPPVSGFKPAGMTGVNPPRSDDVFSAHPMLMFDFWNSRFLGVTPAAYRTALAFEPPAEGSCQVISFRPVTGHPQVLGDDRHISQGAVELDGVKWDGHSLSGRFLATPGRTWNLFLYVPDGYEAISQTNLETIEPHVLKLSFPDGKGWTTWRVTFKRIRD